MSIFLGIQHSYHGIDIALFDKQHVLAAVADDKKRASRSIITLIGQLLADHQLQLRDIPFIAVNQGPGPFTTLRVVIASVNGLSFATKIPLIGIDALDALLEEHASREITTIALLNAFTNDVYYAIKSNSQNLHEKGCKNITALLLEVHEAHPQQELYFIGNGALLHEALIKKIFGTRALYAQPLPEQCSIKQIGIMGYECWQQHKNITYQLLPRYLKIQELGKSIPGV